SLLRRSSLGFGSTCSAPDKALQPAVLPPLRSGKPSAALVRSAAEGASVAKAKSLIDRAAFRPNKFGGAHGVGTAGGRRFGCTRAAESGDAERAWANAERLIRLVRDRFAAIERRVRSDLIPRIDHWAPEKVSLAELARRTVAAMRATETVTLNVSDRDS